MHDYGTPTGGAELQVLALRDGLGAAGHEALLFSSRASLQPGPVEADETCFGTTRGRLQAVSQLVNPSAAHRLRRVMADFRPDVVHVRMFLAQLSPAILPLLRDVPALYQVVTYRPICPRYTKLLPDGSPCQVAAGVACLRNRCVTPQSWPLHIAQLRLWRRWRHVFDAVVTLSQSARAQLEAAGIGPVEVVPNGVPGRPARPPLTGPPLVAFAGRLSPEKGVDVLVEAFAAVVARRPDARLLVAGDGPERSRLAVLVERRGLGHAVELCGHLGRDELEHRFDAAWVQVVPGLWAEPFGNVVTEAMARGTAVVASAIGGPAEIIDDGRTGVLVPPGDAGALGEALAGLVADRDRCERLGRAGRSAAHADYAPALVVERFTSIYERLRAATPPAVPALEEPHAH